MIILDNPDGALVVQVHVHHTTTPQMTRRIASQVAQEVRERFGDDTVCRTEFVYGNGRKPFWNLPPAPFSTLNGASHAEAV